MTRREAVLGAALVAVGVSIRLWVGTLGHNYDMESFWIVAQTVSKGENVYGTTSRYNYGPIWFYLLDWIQQLPAMAMDPFQSFRTKIGLLLALVDAAIALLLLQRHGVRATTLFILSPISILITGYHSQFDNLAILIGLVAATLADTAPREDGVHWVAALALLGVSLTTKHILFAMPVWLAFRAASWRSRTLCLAVPYGIFAASFIPFWARGAHGIVHNVFLYRSFENGPLWSLLLPDALRDLGAVSFAGSLVMFGLVVRGRSVWDLMLIYGVAVVVLSSAMANQYLTIPAAGIAVYMNWAFLGYSLLGAAHIAGSKDGLAIGLLRPAGETPDGRMLLGFPMLTIVLGLGLLVLLWRTRSATYPPPVEAYRLRREEGVQVTPSAGSRGDGITEHSSS